VGWVVGWKKSTNSEAAPAFFFQNPVCGPGTASLYTRCGVHNNRLAIQYGKVKNYATLKRYRFSLHEKRTKGPSLNRCFNSIGDWCVGASRTLVSVTIPVEKRSAGDASAKSGKSSDEEPKSVIRTSTLPPGLLQPRGVRAEVQRKWRHSRE